VEKAWSVGLDRRSRVLGRGGVEEADARPGEVGMRQRRLGEVPGEEGADRGGGSRRVVDRSHVDDAGRRRTAELVREEVARGHRIRRLEAEVGGARWGWPAGAA
jgi:hypothetical protein